jgi:glutamate dehydrogenase
MVDRVGSGFVNDLQERTGEGDAQIARAYLAARRLFGMEALWAEIASLDTAADSAQHRRLMLESREIVENATLWLLRRASGKLDLSASVEAYAQPLAQLLALLPGLSGAAASSGAADSIVSALNSGPATRLDQRLRLLCQASRQLDVLLLAERQRCSVESAARMMFAVDEALALPALNESVRLSAGRGESDTLAAGELIHAAAGAVLAIAERCLNATPGESDPARRVPDYLVPRRALLSRYHAWRAEIGRGIGSELAPVVLAVEALRGLAA